MRNKRNRLLYEFKGSGVGDVNPDEYCADIDERVEQCDDCDVKMPNALTLLDHKSVIVTWGGQLHSMPVEHVKTTMIARYSRQ